MTRRTARRSTSTAETTASPHGENGRWQDRRRTEKLRLLKMEFRTFVTDMIRIPCQIVRTGRRIIYRLLNGNSQQPVFWRLVEVLQL